MLGGRSCTAHKRMQEADVHSPCQFKAAKQSALLDKVVIVLFIGLFSLGLSTRSIIPKVSHILES